MSVSSPARQAAEGGDVDELPAPADTQHPDHPATAVWQEALSWPRVLAFTPLLAIVLWAWALTQVRLRDISDIGLISALPPAYFAALGLLTAGFLVELFRERPRGLVLAGYVGALVVVLHASAPLLYPEPRYTYVYKHLAITRYIDLHGSVRRPLDLYQNWSGFFGLAAFLSRVTGREPAAFANWAQFFFASCNVLAVRYAIRAFTQEVRVVALALWLYVLADWVGQNYFAPQALGYLLSVTAAGLILHTVVPRFRRRPAHVRRPWRDRFIPVVLPRSLRQRPAVADRIPVDPHPALGPVTGALFALALSAAVILSHPLSPFLLIAWLVVLVALGRRSYWWVPAAAVALMCLWIALAHIWLGRHVNLLADLGRAATNASGTAGANPGSHGHQLVAATARTLSIGIWAMAGLAVLYRRWHGHRDLTLPVLIVSPFGLVFAQSYGGEAIYRVYLFSLPWCSLLIAWGLLGAAARPGVVRRLVTGALCVGCAGLFLLAYFGLDQVNVAQPGEVAASTWFEEHAPPGSVLATVAENFPSQVTGHYDRFYNKWGQWGASIVGQEPSFTGRYLTNDDMPAVIDYLRTFSDVRTYVVVSPGQATYADEFGVAPRGAVAQLQRLLLDQPDLQVAYRNGDVVLLQVPPAPKPAPTAATRSVGHIGGPR